MSVNNEKLYECQTCGKTFNRRTYLQLHEKIHGDKCYKCNICEKSFRQPAGLWIHKKHQSCLKRNSGSNKPKNPCKTNEGTEDSEKRHKCDICDRRFSQKHLLVYHERTHTGENPYPCTICGKMFRSIANLNSHSRTHTGHKPYKCIFCVKAFTQVGPLRLHCRNEHQSEKIYECEICREQFEKFKKLSSHKKTHLEVAKHKESLGPTAKCNSPLNQATIDKFIEHKARSNSSVKYDVVLEHPTKQNTVAMNEENSNSNTLLGATRGKRNGSVKLQSTDHQTPTKAPRRDSTITSHGEGGGSSSSVNDESSVSMKGDPYPCTVCVKTFRTRGSLTVHQRTHNGQKPYKCIFCFQSFTQRGALLQHSKRIHATDQIYECNICKEKFKKHKDLSSHRHDDSDVPCTMVEQICDQKFLAEDEEEDLTPTDDYVISRRPSVDALPSISPLNTDATYCNCDTEGDSLESNQLNNTCKQAEKLSVVLNSSDDCLLKIRPPMKFEKDLYFYTRNNLQVLACPSSKRDYDNCAVNNGNTKIAAHSDGCLRMNLKQEKEDPDSSNDSGISRDASPMDVHVESNKNESDQIYEVSMQPVEMDHRGKDRLSAIDDRPVFIDDTIPLQTNETPLIDVSGGPSNASTAELSNCSRVSTPDNDHIFYYCSGDLPQTLSAEEKTENDTSHLFAAENDATLKAQQLRMNNQNVIINNNRLAGGFSDCAETNASQVDLMKEFSDYSSNVQIHPNVFCGYDKLPYSHMR